MFRCENGPCVQASLRCDGKVDCPYDTSDELDCRKSTHELLDGENNEEFKLQANNTLIAINCQNLKTVLITLPYILALIKKLLVLFLDK